MTILRFSSKCTIFSLLLRTLSLVIKVASIFFNSFFKVLIFYSIATPPVNISITFFGLWFNVWIRRSSILSSTDPQVILEDFHVFKPFHRIQILALRIIFTYTRLAHNHTGLLVWTKVIPKMKRMISWLGFHDAIHQAILSYKWYLS